MFFNSSRNSDHPRPASICSCDTGNDNELFDYLIRKYTNSQITQRLKDARRSSGLSSRSGSSSTSGSSSIFSTFTPSPRNSVSCCPIHSDSSFTPPQYDAELPSLTEEPHPGTRVNTDVEPLSQPPCQQVRQNNPSKQYLCPFCAEFDIDNRFSRDSDLVKHFKAYHNTNVLWICRRGGCGRSFDLQSAYKIHLNNDRHPNGPLSPGNDRVLLQPQVVFACGFTGCKDVYEADLMDLDFTQLSKNYFSHVLDHMRKIKNRTIQCPWETPMTWSYSTRMCNLLRQSQVRSCWKAINKEARSKLSWQIQNSTVLRKKLECRDVKDAQLIAQAALDLGSRRLSQTSIQHRQIYTLTLPTTDDAVASNKSDYSLHKYSEVQHPAGHMPPFSNLVRQAVETPNTLSRHSSFPELDHIVVQDDHSWVGNEGSTPSLVPPQDVGDFWAMSHQHMHPQDATYAAVAPPYGFDSGITPDMASHWIPPQSQWYPSQEDVTMGSPPR